MESLFGLLLWILGILALFGPFAVIRAAVKRRRWWLVVAAILALGWYWCIGASMLPPGLGMAAWTWSFLGGALLLLRLKLRRRWLVWGGLALAFAFPLTLCGLSFHEWWTKGRFAKLENRVDWDEFAPFAPGNRLVAATADDSFLFAPDAPIPKVNCAYALYPLGAAAMQALCPRAAYKNKMVRPVSSPDAYDELLMWRSIALVLAPSAEQAAQAKENGR